MIMLVVSLLNKNKYYHPHISKKIKNKCTSVGLAIKHIFNIGKFFPSYLENCYNYTDISIRLLCEQVQSVT